MHDILGNRKPSQEMMLLDLVQRLARLHAGRIGLHLHLSQLSRAYGRGQYLRIATDSFATYISGMEGQLFPLSNGDLFFMAKGVARVRLETAVARLQQLFSQDPLLQAQDNEGRSAFCTWYDLESDYESLLKKAEEIKRADDDKRDQEEKSPLAFAPAVAPIHPGQLSRLEQSLETADVTILTHRQMVCTILDDSAPQTLFEEIYVSIDDLQRIVSPGIDLSSNIWLFRYLTQTLDKRIMSMMIRDGITSPLPFSLNLNVATILTPDFAKFEATITPQLRGRLVIEMNKLDVFSDVGAFMFARDYLHDHGFRLCLDGLTHHTLRYYDRETLGFDLVKLFWAPNAVEDILPGMIPDVRNMVMNTGQAHTILCRCDDERAVALGQELGIVMFQGREVDKRLAMAPTVRKLKV